MAKNVTEKYLQRYAEGEVQRIEIPSKKWRNVLCIPACDEKDSLMSTLESIRRTDGAERSLICVIINATEDAPSGVHESNAACAEQLTLRCRLAGDKFRWGDLDGMDVLLLDRFSPGRRLPTGEGVGLARKIVCDVALLLIHKMIVEKPWIWCTDADVQLPVDYFDRIQSQAQGVSAYIYPFAHTLEGDPLQQQAMQLYESFLHYYVDGLKKAGSPYAFYSIGSLICVDAKSYAMVRGFPKRQAAEDFYLLNKLAKVGSVRPLEGGAVRIQGRESNRVPFGTGAALIEIRALLEEGHPYCVMHPSVFDALGVWLSALDDFVEHRNVDELRKTLRKSSGEYSRILEDVVEGLGAFRLLQSALEHTQNAKDPAEQLRRRIRDWNDGFRTLKIVHGLRDGGLGEIGLEVGTV